MDRRTMDALSEGLPRALLVMGSRDVAAFHQSSGNPPALTVQVVAVDNCADHPCHSFVSAPDNVSPHADRESPENPRPAKERSSIHENAPAPLHPGCKGCSENCGRSNLLYLNLPQ